MRKLIFTLMAALCAASLFVACKPTEKNYKMAYDRAKEKARQGLTDAEYEMMTLNELPGYMHSPTDSVRAFTEGLIWQYTPAAVDSGRKADPAAFNLAVGKYTMLTNAKAHADRLASDGWRSRIFRTGGAVYYVVVKMSNNLDTVAQAARDYVARYPHGTVALHEPMAIIPHHNTVR